MPALLALLEAPAGASQRLAQLLDRVQLLDVLQLRRPDVDRWCGVGPRGGSWACAAIQQRLPAAAHPARRAGAVCVAQRHHRVWRLSVQETRDRLTR